MMIGGSMKLGSKGSVLSRIMAALAVMTLISSGAHSEGLLDKAKANGELVLGTEMQFAPFEFLDDGAPKGYSIDLMNLVAADLGVKTRYIDLPFAGIIPGLEAGKFDLVEATSTITKARLDRYHFTLPIAEATVALVKRKGDTSIQKPEDIAGKSVGSTKGSAQTALLKDYVRSLPGGVKAVEEYIGSPNAYADLEAGRIDAVAGSLPNLAYLVRTRPEKFELVLPAFGPTAYFGWFAKKTDSAEQLIGAINASLVKLNKNGQIKELQLRWFGVEMNLPQDGIPAPNY
jgi:polar amino acid transport system substrate-binding protein